MLAETFIFVTFFSPVVSVYFFYKKGLLCVWQCVLPSVTQDGGVVKRPPPVAVGLVDLSAVLQKELAGCQGILVRKREHVSCYAITFSLHLVPTS